MIIVRFCCGPTVKNQDTITAQWYMAGITKLFIQNISVIILCCCSAGWPVIKSQRLTTPQMTHFPADTRVTRWMCPLTVQRNAPSEEAVLKRRVCTWAELAHKAGVLDVHSEASQWASHSDVGRGVKGFNGQLHLTKNKAYFSLRGLFQLQKHRETHKHTNECTLTGRPTLCVAKCTRESVLIFIALCIFIITRAQEKKQNTKAVCMKMIEWN